VADLINQKTLFFKHVDKDCLKFYQNSGLAFNLVGGYYCTVDGKKIEKFD